MIDWKTINYDNLALAVMENMISKRTIVEGIENGSIDGGKLAQAMHDHEVRRLMPDHLRRHRPQIAQIEPVPVVLLTEPLKEEIKQAGLTYHLWKGHIVIDYRHFSEHPYRATRTAESRPSTSLARLLSLDYNLGIRQMQEAESRG